MVSGVNQNKPVNQGADAVSAASKDLGSKEVFLQLLVSQIKNQDPLNPMDSMNFVTQLAQFSQLEATLGIRNDLSAVLQSRATADEQTNTLT